MVNKKVIKKRRRSIIQISCDKGVTILKGLKLFRQPNQLVEVSEVVSYAQGQTPDQADRPATRAPPKVQWVQRDWPQD